MKKIVAVLTTKPGKVYWPGCSTLSLPIPEQTGNWPPHICLDWHQFEIYKRIWECLECPCGPLNGKGDFSSFFAVLSPLQALMLAATKIATVVNLNVDFINIRYCFC